MNEPNAEPASPPQKAYTFLAWMVILGLVAYTFWNQHRAGDRLRTSGDELGLIIQGRILVGLNELPDQSERVSEEISNLTTGPYRQRLLTTILVADVQGKEQARDHLKTLDSLQEREDYHPTPHEAKLRSILGRLYAPEPRENLSNEDRELLDRYDWVGRLALSHAPGADPMASKQLRAEALRGLMLLGVLLLGAGAVGLLGCVFLVDFCWNWSRGRIHWAMEPRNDSGLYLEGFAVWFATFLGLGRLAAFVPSLGTLTATGLAMMLSTTLALLWCRLRGRDTNRIRTDLGLHSGRSIWLEILHGFATYAAMLPLVVVAVGIIMGLTYLQDHWATGGGEGNPFAPSSRPSHPISQLVLGDAWMALMIYITAAMIAPLVEEVAFRGLLQRYLRGFLSRLISAAGVALIFAIIHPQGALGVPALMAIAIPLSLVREWRGSLVASITAHALNNAVTATLLLVATR